MESHGMHIDIRHIQLLADVMTFKGKVLGINRHGVHKMKNSTLMLASFEQTTDHLYDAAVHCKRDDITGVSECIITGNLVSLGTGAFKLCHDDSIEPVKIDGKAETAATSVAAPAAVSDGFNVDSSSQRTRTLLFDNFK